MNTLSPSTKRIYLKNALIALLSFGFALQVVLDADERETITPAMRYSLFAGLMLTKEGPKVLEFNARFGDPETQVLMMLLQSDLAPILQACVGGHLEKVEIRFRKGAAVCVVMAAEGYPENPKKGDEISGMDTIHDPNVTIFHAGTKIREDKSIETNGGRVLGVTAYGNNMSIARTRANAAVSRINFKGRRVRTDIARKF